jgi:hypothetical protein
MSQQEKGRVVVLARPLLAGEQEASSNDLHIDEISKVTHTLSVNCSARSRQLEAFRWQAGSAVKKQHQQYTCI